MSLSLTRWHPITESFYPWEQDALDFVRQERCDPQDLLAAVVLAQLGQRAGRPAAVLQAQGRFLQQVAVHRRFEENLHRHLPPGRIAGPIHAAAGPRAHQAKDLQFGDNGGLHDSTMQDPGNFANPSIFHRNPFSLVKKNSPVPP